MTITVDNDMQAAIEELKQAQQMFDNAANEWRVDEANYRILAANSRIQAIRFEKQELVGVK